MYTLRKTTEQKEINYLVGDNYSLVDSKRHPENFKAENENFNWSLPNDNKFKDLVYAFIHTESGQTIPLYKDEQNYIMTENGQTFSNLSFK